MFSVRYADKNVMSRSLFTILFLIHFSVWGGMPNHSSLQLRSDLKAIENLNKKGGVCDQSKDQCSNVLKTLISSDKEDAFLGLLESRYNSCALYVKDDKNSEIFKSPQDLSRQLAQDQFAGTVSSQSSPVNRCISSDGVQSKAAISKYYYYVGRLQLTQSSAIEEIADIDRVLGKSPLLSGVNCQSMPFEKNQKRCDEVQKNCQAKEGLDQLAKDVKVDLDRVAVLEKEIADIRKSPRPPSSQHEELKKRVAILQMKQMEISMIRSRSPVITGEIFKKESSKDLKNAIRLQLLENRKDINNHLNDATFNHLCLTGTVVTRNCSAEKVRDFIEDKTPDIVNQWSQKNVGTKKESMTASSYISFQQCVHEGKVDQLKTNDILKSSALNAALTVITLGVGSAFSGAKAIMTARSMQLAKTTKILNGTVNGVSLAVATADAAKSCLSDDKKLQGKLSETKEMCMVSSALSSRMGVKEYDDCLLKTSFALLGLAPFAAGALQKLVLNENLSKYEKLLLKKGVSKEEMAAEKAAILRGETSSASSKVVSSNAALDDTARTKAIADDFKNLRKDQIDCVVKNVHTIGAGTGVYKYSKDQISQKAKTLRRTCQVGVEDTEALLRLGYAGDLPADAGGAEFLKIINKTSAASEAASSSGKRSVAELKSQLEKKSKELASADDPLTKVKLKDEMKAIENDMMAKMLEENPKILDDVIKSTAAQRLAAGKTELEPIQVGSKNAIKLSVEKQAQLDKAGVSTFEQMMIEIKPGETVYFKSFSFGNGMAKIKGEDPEQPGHILVQILGSDPKKTRTVSMSQADIAMTDKEKAEAMLLTINESRKTGKAELQRILDNDSNGAALGSKLVDDLAKDVGRAPLKREADSLMDEMSQIKSRYSDNLSALTDPNYVAAAKKYQQLTSLSPEETQTLRALSEIDLSRAKPTSAELKVIEDAKKIRQGKSEVDLSPEAKTYFKQIDTVDQQVKTSADRYIDRQVKELNQINQSTSYGRRNDYPSQKNFESSFVSEGQSLSTYDKNNYKAMEKLFTENPKNMSAESEQWLRSAGSTFYNRATKTEVSNETKDYFTKRLKVYLEVLKADGSR